MHLPVEQCFQPKDHLGYSQLARNRCSIEPGNSFHMIISPCSVKNLPLILWEQDSSCPWEYQGRWLLGSWRCSGRCGCGRSPWAAWRGTRGWSGCRGRRRRPRTGSRAARGWSTPTRTGCHPWAPRCQHIVILHIRISGCTFPLLPFAC